MEKDTPTSDIDILVTAALHEIPVPAGVPPLDRDVARPAETARTRSGLLLLAGGLLLIAVNLRMGVASVGPVLKDVQSSLGISSGTASLLTTIPVFAFGAFAFLCPPLTRRLGAHRLLGISVGVLAAGVVMRLAPGLGWLSVGTVLIGAGIAVGNVLIPAVIKSDLATHSGLMMGLHTTMLYLGAALASGLTVPALTRFGGWQAALAVWAVPAGVALFVWIPQMLQSPGEMPRSEGVTDAPSPAGEPPFRAILRDRTALAVTLFMGLGSTVYYATLTWIPVILQDAGMDAHTAGWMLSVSGLVAMVASLFTPVIAERLRPTWLTAMLIGILSAIGLFGMLVAPVGGAYVWMISLGLALGAGTSLALACIVWRSPDARHAGHLSTMAQGFGYLLAGFGPLVIGLLRTVTHSWIIPLLVLVLVVGVQVASGLGATRERHILTPLQ